ncbi:MAG: hypothetical protein KTR31_07995 [Myxococcales bacterium]|nr:hypothetical protein [Myxococcales bacterium]
MLALIAPWIVGNAAATPFPDQGWVASSCGDEPMLDAFDDEADAADARDLVGVAGFELRADEGLYVRMRLDDDPNPGALLPHTWAILFDTDDDDATYEAQVRLDGDAAQGALHANTEMTPADDPREPPDTPPLTTWPLDGTFRTLVAPDSSNGDDDDFFLDVLLDWGDLQQVGVDFKAGEVRWLATSSGPDGRLDGDLVCDDGTAPVGPGDTGMALLEGGGGCAEGCHTSTTHPQLAWLGVGLLLLARRRRS